MLDTSPESSHPFSQSDVHHDEQIQRVVSPGNQASLAHYQAQYAAYDPYHHRPDVDPSQHDPRQQVPMLTQYHANTEIQQDWNSRRQSVPLATPEQRAVYRYHEVENQNGYIR
jgi:hypothetical protein